ncbi:hypothetical protein PABG_03741 [Paracoccidioides brasiliensis Pb03]|nr:hypothetical protein PABG_03741 [Paracoccidioides brasiliensis Pb03]
MASIAPWETRAYYWDPDVIFSGYVNNFQLGFCIEWHTRPLHIDSGKWALIRTTEDWFFTIREKTKESLRRLCVVFAISEGSDPAGPYHPMQEPLACHPNKAARPTQQHRNGGDFNNGKPLIVGMPIYVQNVERDGVTKFGDPVTTLDRDESDGPLVEAPSLIRTPEGL